MKPGLACGMLALGACLGPQVSDEVDRSQLVLPAGTSVPSLYDDAAVNEKIADATGIAGTVRLYSGFAGGAPTAYWNVGPAPDHGIPIYVLTRKNTSGAQVPIGQPAVIDILPGDTFYSPFWIMFAVEVTDTYTGQVLPSLDAIREGVREGLLLPAVRTKVALDCPVVTKDVLLAAGGAATIAPTPFYYRGQRGLYLDLGRAPLDADGTHIHSQNLYVLHREGGEPLSEPLRNVDMDGDGDIDDTNDVFAADRTSPAYSPLCRIVSVSVAASTRSIDSFASQTMSDVRTEADLFSPALVPVAGRVVAYQVQTQLINCAQKVP